MKKTVALLLVFSLFSALLIGQSRQGQEIPIWKKMHYLSEEEMYLPNNNVLDFIPTDPPDHPVRMVGEYENMQSVLVRYPFGVPTSLIIEMSQDCGVTTIVANQSQQNTVTSIYQSNGANMANIDFIQAPTDSYWTRDYGPWFVIDGNGDFGVCDFPYNRPRPNDDEIPIKVADYLGIPWYGMALEGAGGNWMCTGIRQAASTDLIWEENMNMTHEEIDEMVSDYLGIEQYHVLPDPLGEYIKHIDCWGKFLDVNKVLIGSVSSGDPRYSDFEYVADYFANTICDWGVPYEVYRVYTPGNYPYTPYTNSLILNKKIFVPLTGSQHDAAALEAYEAAMPGYEIIGVMYDGWENTDALHCRTKGIADMGMLHIKHMPLLGNIQMQDEYTITATITANSGSPLYADSVRVYYRENGGAYQSIQMIQQLGNVYAADIPFQDEGTIVEYYIHAADESGRSMNHPYIGAPDPHEFTVVQFLPGIMTTPDTLLFTDVVQAMEGLDVKIFPADEQDVIIDYINLEASDVFYWWAEPIVDFPYLLTAGDSLVLTVYIGIPTDNPLGFVQDTMFVECSGGDRQVLIIVDEDIISATQEPVKQSLVKNIFPNPFTRSANIMVELMAGSNVEGMVYDMRGNMVRKIAEGRYTRGTHSLHWDGNNDAGQECPAGIYYFVMKTDFGQQTGKIIKR
ncbi:MAG TPA: agmatine deiminase family protein [Bacteroidales bacterium]|nr:agmatine deiminase family protein [Bacteroidales bacterium]